MRKVLLLALVAIALINCRKNNDDNNVNISPNDYQLSTDGLTLIKWTNSSTVSIDMQGDSNLRNVNTIAEKAFKGLKNLRAITFSDNLKEIGTEAFAETNLSDAVNFNTLSNVAFGEKAFFRTSIRKIALPNTKKLPDRMFAECRNLKEVTFSKTKTIGEGVFHTCTTLEQINLSETELGEIGEAEVGGIGKEAFANCKGLKIVILPKTMNLKPIGDKAFANCQSLQNLTIYALYPPSLEGEPFYGIPKSKLPNVYIPNEPNLLDIYKNSTVWKNMLDKIQVMP